MDDASGTQQRLKLLALGELAALYISEAETVIGESLDDGEQHLLTTAAYGIAVLAGITSALVDPAGVRAAIGDMLPEEENMTDAPAFGPLFGEIMQMVEQYHAAPTKKVLEVVTYA